MRVNTKTKGLVEKIKDEILGKQYELSFAFIGKTQIKKLNLTYRNKNEPTDILSFPIEKNVGEILICEQMLIQKSKINHFKPADYFLFLIVHGCLHLKGLRHGPKMEKLEQQFYKKFK